MTIAHLPVIWRTVSAGNRSFPEFFHFVAASYQLVIVKISYGIRNSVMTFSMTRCQPEELRSKRIHSITFGLAGQTLIAKCHKVAKTQVPKWTQGNVTNS